MRRKGQVVLYLVFLITAIIIIMITAVIAPLGARINTEFYSAGEDILEATGTTSLSIQDATVRNHIGTLVNESLDASVTNIEVNTALFKYSWLFVLGITVLFLFILSRSLTEFAARGGGGFV